MGVVSGGGEGSPNPLPGLQSRVSNRSGGFGGVRSEGRSLVMPWGGTWASCARTPSCFAEAVKRELAPGSPVRGTAPGGGSGRSLRVERDHPVRLCLNPWASAQWHCQAPGVSRWRSSLKSALVFVSRLGDSTHRASCAPRYPASAETLAVGVVGFVSAGSCAGCSAVVVIHSWGSFLSLQVSRGSFQLISGWLCHKCLFLPLKTAPKLCFVSSILQPICFSSMFIAPLTDFECIVTSYRFQLFSIITG